MAGAQSSPAARNVIVVLLDSLNRHMVGAYGGREFDTPNLDRFAARSVRFDSHFAGSLPCMPARHDILVGTLDFLWRPWGSIELWEEAVTEPLRRAGVTTMLVSDHPHLFETGGENYHTEFRAWDYLRGHETDPWKTRPDPSWIGCPDLPAVHGRQRPYDLSRSYFREEADFPGPRTMSAAARWLADNAGFHDRFMLFVDEFDPHEPFDTPARWANRYDPDWTGERLIWPPYSVKTVERGVLDERQARHLRANYGAKLSMIDHWLGAILDQVDELRLWQDTAIIVCTDHGHFLGEKDIFGKPGVPLYEPIGHIPLFVYVPGVAPGSRHALTTNVDINATLYDLFGLAPHGITHGRSLLPLLSGARSSIRDWALAGVYGRWVHVLDGRHKYARGPVHESNLPLSMWSNRWSTMPVHGIPDMRLPKPNRRAFIDFMPGSEVPVLRQPFDSGDTLPYWCRGQPAARHCLYDLDDDPDETRNLLGSPLEREMGEMLHAALSEVEAPREQFHRLGIG